MSRHYTGKRFKCDGCGRMLSYSAIRHHKTVDDCSEKAMKARSAANGALANNQGHGHNKGRGKLQMIAKNMFKRKMFGETELIYWDEKNRWATKEIETEIARASIPGKREYGNKTQVWEGKGDGFTKAATIELWCNGEIDSLKERLNTFTDRTDIKVVMTMLGWHASGVSRKEAYNNLVEDYPLERFTNAALGSGHGGENSNFSLSAKEHARRISLLEKLPDNCGKEGIKAALGNAARKKSIAWSLGNYADIDRLIPNMPSSALSVARTRAVIMKAYDARGWTRKVITKICCEVGCEEKSIRWYRCNEHADLYIGNAYKITKSNVKWVI